MKKLICLLLALVMILALAGCRVSNRPYRRYATPYVTDDGTYNAPGKTYRSNLRPRTVNPADAPLYDTNSGDTVYRSGTRGTTGRTAVPSPAVPLPTATIPPRANGSLHVAS